MHCTARLACLASCLSLVACSGGAETSGSPEESGVDCNYQEGEIAFDQKSVMGYSAEQRFGAYLGSHACSWTWREPSEDVSLLAPGPGKVGARVSLEYDGGPVTYAQDMRLGDVSGGLSPCRRLLLEVPMLLEIETDDGVFHIRKATVFRVYQGEETFAEHSLDRAELPGYEFGWADGSPVNALHLRASVDTQSHAGSYSPRGLQGVLLESSVDSQSDFISADWRCE